MGKGAGGDCAVQRDMISFLQSGAGGGRGPGKAWGPGVEDE